MLPGQFTRLKGCDMSLAIVRFGSFADKPSRADQNQHTAATPICMGAFTSP